MIKFCAVGFFSSLTNFIVLLTKKNPVNLSRLSQLEAETELLEVPVDTKSIINPSVSSCNNNNETFCPFYEFSAEKYRLVNIFKQPRLQKII